MPKNDSFLSAPEWAKRRANSGLTSVTIARMETDFNAAEQGKTITTTSSLIQFSVAVASENPIFRCFLKEGMSGDLNLVLAEA